MKIVSSSAPLLEAVGAQAFNSGRDGVSGESSWWCHGHESIGTRTSFYGHTLRPLMGRTEHKSCPRRHP